MWNQYKEDDGAESDIPEGIPAEKVVSKGKAVSRCVIVVQTNEHNQESSTSESLKQNFLGPQRVCGLQ